MDAQPPSGLVDCYIGTYYHQEIAFLDNKQKQQNLHAQDLEHCQFLIGMTQTYRDLTSSDELDIFDINKD